MNVGADLGICYTQPFWFDGESYTTTDTSIVLPMHVGRDEFDQIRLMVPFKRSDTERGPLALNLGTDTSLIPGLDPNRITVHPLPFVEHAREWYSFGALPDIRAAAQAIREGVTHCDFVWLPAPPHVPTMLCYWYCRRSNVSALLYIRSDQAAEIAAQEFESLLSLKQWLGGRLLPRIERQMVHSLPTVVAGPELAQKYGDTACRLDTIRAIHLPASAVLDDPEPAIEANKASRLLYVGRLVPIKGLDDLVEAVARLRDRGYDVTLDIIGDGKSRPDIEHTVTAAGLDDVVTFHGFVPFGPKLFKMYQNSDVFVLPSYSEGFPNVILEALANGVPVVTTRVGGIDSIVEDGRNGVLIPAGEPDAIVTAIDRLNDKKLRGTLIRNGIKTARNYTVETQKAKLIEIVREESHAD